MSIASDKDVLTALLPALNVLLAAHGNCVPCRENWLANANMALTHAGVRVHYEWQVSTMALVPFDMPHDPGEVDPLPVAADGEQVPPKRSHHKKAAALTV